jgi:O-antigen biosynthesis protein
MENSPPLAAAVPPTDAQYSKKFHLWLDEPLEWQLKVRRLRITGWCVARSGPPLTAIRARLGGKIFNGRFDRERADAAEYLAQYHGKPDAPRFCGFTVDVEVPFGRKRLELQATADGQTWQKAFACSVTGPLVISEAERRVWREIEERETRGRFLYSLSRPHDWTAPARRLHIVGWCIDQAGDWIHGIRATVGKRDFVATFPIERADVAAAYPGNQTALRSGFAVTVELPPGACEVGLDARDATGRWRPILTHAAVGSSTAGTSDEELSVDELAAIADARRSRFEYWFDRPADWSAKARHLHISGWCLPVWGDDIAEIRGRIGSKSFRANYGIVRPDVAATYGSGPAALRSGFSMDVIVPRGTSTLVLECRSKGGDVEPFFSTAIRGPLLLSGSSDDEEPVGNYRYWIREYDTVSRSDAERIRREVAALERKPSISVLLPAYNSNARWLRRAIDSVRAQFYENWELCAVDDASTDPQVWKILQDYARRDARIKVQRRDANGHISATSNDALAIATGDFIALLDHDDELAPTALYLVARAMNEHPGARLFYSDEDKLDKQGRRTDPYFKPDWNPDLFLAQNYTSHLSVYDAALVRQVGGFRLGFEGSQDYDLTLRCIEQLAPAQIHHIPHVLYHWRIADESTATFAAAKPYAFEAAIRAVQEHLDRRGAHAEVVAHYANYQRVIYPPPADEPLVSIIIPTRDRGTLLRQCIESITAKTEYRNFELIVVDNESRESQTLEYLRALAESGSASVLRTEGEFNFSRLNNRGVAQAGGEFIALLNNDLEVMSGDWLGEMLSHAARRDVGAVGARLWYPDGTMQHGGVILGVGGVATHAHVGLRREHGYFARAHLTQNFSAVTGACLLTRRETYQQLGGLDETNLAVAFNDVDFCLRIAEAGLRVVWTPHAELRHHESASRGLEDTGAKQRRFLAEVAFMREKWGHVLEADPFYNPNLSIESQKQFKLAFPPRVSKPWRQNPAGTRA